MLCRNIRTGDIITPNIAEFRSLPLLEGDTWQPLLDNNGNKVVAKFGEICIALFYEHDEVHVLTSNGFVGWSAGRNWMIVIDDQ